MGKVENEKSIEKVESSVLISPEKASVSSCGAEECHCSEYYYICKLLTWFSVPLLLFMFTIVFIFGFHIHQNLETYKCEIVELKRNLKNVQMECGFSVDRLRSEIKNVEKSIEQKINVSKQENKRELHTVETSGNHDASTVEIDNLSHPQNHFSNFLNVNDNISNFNLTLNEHNENTMEQKLLNGTTTNLQLDRKMCNMLSLLDEASMQEYAKQCEELDLRSGRTRRANPRGPVASHFKGAVPETYIRDGGSLVAPWYPDDKASAAFTLKYEFREGKGTIEVSEEGLYLIYSQVYYLTSDSLNSYVINVREKDSQVKPLAYCSVNAVVPKGGVTEVSCYTAVIRYLNATNQVYITQRDRNRRMILREGHSFLGLVRLNSVPEPKRRRASHD